MWALALHGCYAGTWLASFKSEHLHQLGNAPPQSAGSRPRRPKAHQWRKGSKPSAVESRDGGRQAVSAKWQQPPSAAGGSSAMCASSGSTLRQRNVADEPERLNALFARCAPPHPPSPS